MGERKREAGRERGKYLFIQWLRDTVVFAVDMILLYE